jgi:hypothetical protein
MSRDAIYRVSTGVEFNSRSSSLANSSSLSPSLLTTSCFVAGSKSQLQNLITNYELVLSVAEVLRISLTPNF